MDKKILVAYSGGQDAAYVLRLLQAVAEREGSAYGYYLPAPTSMAACAQRAFILIGRQGPCKEFLPEEADVLLALEELEGRRGVRFLAKDGILILCSCHRLPMAVAVGTTGYPTDVLYRCVSEGRKVWQIKRVEMQNPFIGAMLLRALDYTAEDTSAILADFGTPIEAEQLQAVYAKEFSK